MSTPEIEALPPLEIGVAQSLAERLHGVITAAAIAAPGRPASAEAKKLAIRRVPPDWHAKFDVMDEYGFVVWDETMTILDRILVYPFTTTYRKHLAGAPTEVTLAWQFHSHSLRVGELYIVFDRTLALLAFLEVVGRDCGMPVASQRKAFEKAFKKTFERHLRERHRLTHAHERPSMLSRITDMSGARWAGDDQQSVEERKAAIVTILATLIQAGEAIGSSALTTPEEVEAIHERGAHREARQMLKLVGEALLATLNLPLGPKAAEAV